jgi:hypothetical protein
MCVLLLTFGFFFFLDVPSYYPCYGRDCPSYSHEVYGGEVEAAVPDLIHSVDEKGRVEAAAVTSIFVCMAMREGKANFWQSVCTAEWVWRDELR